VIGAVLAFLVGILDGIDGKLARIRGQESKLGLMEHPFDMLFEFSWYIALALHLHWMLNDAIPLIICLVILLAIAFYRFIYDQFRKATGMSLDDYGTLERYFRRIAGRRNLYNVPILIGALFGVPFYALIAILCHATLTAIVYAWRACSHLRRIDLGSFS
jgi:phosphatidylglycerophosphate synthase